MPFGRLVCGGTEPVDLEVNVRPGSACDVPQLPNDLLVVFEEGEYGCVPDVRVVVLHTVHIGAGTPVAVCHPHCLQSLRGLGRLAYF